jgi:RHS repeat-associated protein
LSGIGYAYDALGTVISQSAFGTPSAIAYQYTGQEFDRETGLHNFRARLYDSDLFRFYATDPAGQQHSPYAFVGNSPLY